MSCENQDSNGHNSLTRHVYLIFCTFSIQGHNGWVTQIATNPKYPDMILSSSRDKSLIVWKLTRDEVQYGYPQKRLTGHGHFVSDVVLSSGSLHNFQWVFFDDLALSTWPERTLRSQ